MGRTIHQLLSPCPSFPLETGLRVKLWVGWFLLFCSSTFANDLLLDEYLSQVKQSNLSLRSLSLRSEALDQRVSPAGTLDDPFVGVGMDQIPFDGGMGNVMRYQLSQAIPFPGKLSAKSSVAENRAKSAKSDVETISREIAVLATQAFYRAYYNQKARDLTDRLKQIIQTTVESAKSRYKTGDTGHHDWLLANIELSVIDVDKLRLLREQKTIQAIMNELRDQSAETSFGRVVVKFSSDDLKDSEPSPFENQPELKSLDFLVHQTVSEQRLANLSYFPDFVIQGMAMVPSSDIMDEKSNWGIMIGLNIPLYFLGEASGDTILWPQKKRHKGQFLLCKESFWKEGGTTKAAKLSRHAAVIHLRTPLLEQGYNHQNPIRIETANQAIEIDQRIAQAWDGHPRVSFVESSYLYTVKSECISNHSHRA